MLEALRNLIQEIRDKEIEGYNFEQSLQYSKYVSERYESIFSDWLDEIKNGNKELIMKIEEILKEEMDKRRRNGEFPSPKRNNALWIIPEFKRKLSYLHFEIEKQRIGLDDLNCYCRLRQEHNIEPSSIQTLKKFGKAFLYHREDTYLIYECEYCNAKWIKADIGGVTISMERWKKWDEEEYKLIEKFD